MEIIKPVKSTSYLFNVDIAGDNRKIINMMDKHLYLLAQSKLLAAIQTPYIVIFYKDRGTKAGESKS